jgi:hypothetical protein
MLELQHIEQHITSHGRVDGHELKVLRHAIYANGTIDSKKADYLVEIYKRVRYRTPAFKQFFYEAIKDYMVAGGRIGPKKTAWLRDALFADGKVEDEARTFLHRLKGEAAECSPEFEALYKEVMKQPPERRTSGG